MSRPRLILEVALREFKTRARTTAFRAITALLVVAAIAGPVAVALWPDSDDNGRDVSVGLVGQDQQLQDRIGDLADGSLVVEFVPLAEASETEIREALSSGEVDLVIEMSDTLLWHNEVDQELGTVVRAALQQTAAVARGQAAGLSVVEVAQLFTPVEIEDGFVREPTSSDDFRQAIAALALFGAFIIPQVFGQLTLLSVVEEKSTGVVEVLLSHIRPRTLLLGKVLGLTLLATGQVLVFLAGLGAAMLATNALDVSGSVWQFVPVLAVSLLGGLVLFNTLFALLGSLISRQEDASQVMLPVFVPLMSGFFVGQAAIGGQADSVVAKVFTFIPFTAPMLLPVRVARDAIAPWEVALSLGLLVLGGWILIGAAARAYEFTLLHSGSRVGWKQAWRVVRG